MAQVKNCTICGRFFDSDGYVQLCPPCKQRDDSDYTKIREYLFLHPMAKIFEVSNVLNIPVPTIKRYLREDRLEIVEKNNLFLKCEACKKPIRSGMYCEDCQKQKKRNDLNNSGSSSLGNSPNNAASPDNSETKVNFRSNSSKSKSRSRW